MPYRRKSSVSSYGPLAGPYRVDGRTIPTEFPERVATRGPGQAAVEQAFGSSTRSGSGRRRISFGRAAIRLAGRSRLDSPGTVGALGARFRISCFAPGRFFSNLYNQQRRQHGGRDRFFEQSGGAGDSRNRAT